jgi:MEDS: MEthanogen/methylotroph, DcmR Sensory domain
VTLADAHTLAVDQLRLGDHAFVEYGDDHHRWEIAVAFAGLGYAARDKVVIVPDPAVSPADACERIAAGAMLGQAVASGQLICMSMREMIGPEQRFSAPDQLLRLCEAASAARREGFGGLRLFIDMRWVHDLDFDVESMMGWEKSAHELFARGDIAAVCSYDRRAFTPEVVQAMRADHPAALLDRPGELGAYRSAQGCHLIGDADIVTRTTFRAVIAAALDAAAGGRALLDLSRLCFLSVGCASDLLRLAGTAGCDQVMVRSSAAHARLLRRLGAAGVAGLVLTGTAGSR